MGGIRGHCDGNWWCRRWAGWRKVGDGDGWSFRNPERKIFSPFDCWRAQRKFPTGLRVSQPAPPQPPLTAFSKWPRRFLPHPTPKLIPALGFVKKNLSASHDNLPSPPHPVSPSATTTKMAPPKRTQKPAQENISLGPQVREGKNPQPGKPQRQLLSRRDG